MQTRTVFISDVHLGTKGCQARLLTQFLDGIDAETFYLIGDIFDGWRLRRGWHWPEEHNAVIQTILKKSQNGARVIYVPGNHDEVMRGFIGTHFGGVEVKQNDVFLGANGKKYLITHGDEFDSVIANARWLAYLGDRTYNLLIWLNPKVNWVRRLWSPRYWSLSKWCKQQVKQAVNYISDYEDVLVRDARQKGFDGVICGHIHHACIREIDGIDYINTGDWVESCTAIVEDHDGRFRLIDWEARQSRLRVVSRRPFRRNRSREEHSNEKEVS